MIFLSVVFSFRNEESNIPELIQRMRTSIEPLAINYELIFVNDDSNDRSVEILHDYGRKDPRVKLVNMSRRFGNAPCVLAGLRYSSGSAVLVMDTDLQDPPELIPTLIREFEKGADVVYTTRRQRAGENRLKMLITKAAYRAINKASQIELPVDSGDFKLMSRKVVNQVLQFREYDPYLRGLVSWVGYKQVAVLYDRQSRHSGRTHFPIFGSGPARAFLAGITSFSTLPLELTLLAGVLISLSAVVYLLTLGALALAGWQLGMWTAFVGLGLVLGGIQLVSVGIIGIYLARVLSHVQGRPSYIVDSTFGFKQEESRPAKNDYRLSQQSSELGLA